jgi:hypothetical protein
MDPNDRVLTLIFGHQQQGVNESCHAPKLALSLGQRPSVRLGMRGQLCGMGCSAKRQVTACRGMWRGQKFP